MTTLISENTVLIYFERVIVTFVIYDIFVCMFILSVAKTCCNCAISTPDLFHLQ